MMTWISKSNTGVYIQVRLSPRSSKNEIQGEVDNSLKIKIKAPPVDGAANKELIKYLAKILKTSKSSISLLSGHTSKHKRLLITGLTEKDIVEHILQSSKKMRSI